MADDPMDDRRHYTGSTLVYSDRYGPREFWRGGQRVSCVCDSDHGVTCAYHGPQRPQADDAGKAAKRQGRRKRAS